jgi:predicted SAM-dependent methyltransferase
MNVKHVKVNLKSRLKKLPHPGLWRALNDLSSRTGRIKIKHDYLSSTTGRIKMKHSYKSLYFAIFYYPMRANALRHRLLPSRGRPGKVHLGPGARNYLIGWTNIDANFLTAKIDIWADLSAKLPFTAETVEAFYSYHVIEHLSDRLLPFHFSEMYRALTPGGMIRVGGPNADMAIKKFEEHDLDWFATVPDRRRSIGGRFVNQLLWGGEHLTILTASYLRELAEDAGFEQINFCKPVQDTRFPSVFDEQVLSTEWESTPDFPHTLMMEARKPLRGSRRSETDDAAE